MADYFHRRLTELALKGAETKCSPHHLQPPQLPLRHDSRLRRGQVTQAIRRIIAANTIFIGIHLEHILRPIRIVLDQLSRLTSISLASLRARSRECNLQCDFIRVSQDAGNISVQISAFFSRSLLSRCQFVLCIPLATIGLL